MNNDNFIHDETSPAIVTARLLAYAKEWSRSPKVREKANHAHMSRLELNVYQAALQLRHLEDGDDIR